MSIYQVEILYANTLILSDELRVTKFCENRSKTLNLDVSEFKKHFIGTSSFKNSMYPRSFLCEEAKIKQHTFSKKELCEFSEEAIWESRFISFFLIVSQRYHRCFQYIPQVGIFWTDCRLRVFCPSLRG